MTILESRHTAPAGRRELKTHPMFHRVFTATPFEVRAALSDLHTRFHDLVGDETFGRLELVLAEVMNNVSKHGRDMQTAGDGPRVGGAAPSIHLCIVRHDAGLACAITDDGVSVPAECLLPRSLPERDQDGLPEGGFGWYLIQDLTQSLCYYREDRRNFLAFSIPFPAENLTMID